MAQSSEPVGGGLIPTLHVINRRSHIKVSRGREARTDSCASFFVAGRGTEAAKVTSCTFSLSRVKIRAEASLSSRRPSFSCAPCADGNSRRVPFLETVCLTCRPCRLPFSAFPPCPSAGTLRRSGCATSTASRCSGAWRGAPCWWQFAGRTTALPPASRGSGQGFSFLTTAPRGNAGRPAWPGRSPTRRPTWPPVPEPTPSRPASDAPPAGRKKAPAGAGAVGSILPAGRNYSLSSAVYLVLPVSTFCSRVSWDMSAPGS